MVRIVCDGCHAEGTTESLTTVGRVDPTLYCPACLAIWRQAEMELEVELNDWRKAFALRREVIRARLPLKGTPGG